MPTTKYFEVSLEFVPSDFRRTEDVEIRLSQHAQFLYGDNGTLGSVNVTGLKGTGIYLIRGIWYIN